MLAYHHRQSLCSVNAAAQAHAQGLWSAATHPREAIGYCFNSSTAVIDVFTWIIINSSITEKWIYAIRKTNLQRWLTSCCRFFALPFFQRTGFLLSFELRHFRFQSGNYVGKSTKYRRQIVVVGWWQRWLCINSDQQKSCTADEQMQWTIHSDEIHRTFSHKVQPVHLTCCVQWTAAIVFLWFCVFFVTDNTQASVTMYSWVERLLVFTRICRAIDVVHIAALLRINFTQRNGLLSELQNVKQTGFIK